MSFFPVPLLSSFTYQPHIQSQSQQSQSLDNIISLPRHVPEYNQIIAHVILKSVFGFDFFYKEQEESIRASLSGNDVLVVMATGAGKSLCYFFPTIYIQEFERATLALTEAKGIVSEAAILHKALKTTSGAMSSSTSSATSSNIGCTLVISPLIALMRDQVRILDLTVIRAIAIDHTTTNLKDVFFRIKNGEYHLILTSPESATYVANNLRQSVHLIAIDEAHCISEWGSNFRQEYQLLGNLREQFFPGVPIVAVTATATQNVRQDICRQLALEKPFILVASFNRPNLRYEVSVKTNVKSDITRVLNSINGHGSIIVYTISRNQCENVCKEIQELLSSSSSLSTSLSSSSSSSLTTSSLRVDFYHGNRTPADKSRIQDDFMNGSLQIIVSTTAFGMGVNKPDVRAVIHYGMPLSIESYFQQTGRAGRDGIRALCVLFWSKSDLNTLRLLKISQEVIGTMRKYCIDTNSCRRRRLLDHFDEKIMLSTVCDEEKCDVCLPTVCSLPTVLPSSITLSTSSTTLLPVKNVSLGVSSSSSTTSLSSPLMKVIPGGSSSSTFLLLLSSSSFSTSFPVTNVQQDVSNPLSSSSTTSLLGTGFLSDFYKKVDEDEEENENDKGDDDLEGEEGEGDYVQHHSTSADDAVISRIGSWNMRATSSTIDGLEEKVSCLIFRASVEGWSVFVLQECPSLSITLKLIELIRQCEYFVDWNFSSIETSKGQVAITAYDSSRWRRLINSQSIDDMITNNGQDPSPLIFEKSKTTSDEKQQLFTNLPSLVFLQSKEANDDIILAIVNIHLHKPSSLQDDTTYKEACQIASDVIPWVEQEASQLKCSNTTAELLKTVSSSSSSSSSSSQQDLSILVLGNFNLAPPNSFMNSKTHPKNAWDTLESIGFECVLPSGIAGLPGVETNVALFPSTKPQEVDNAFFRKPISIQTNLSLSSSSSSLSTSSSSFSSSSLPSFELKATGIVHELPLDELNAWRDAQNIADLQLANLVKHLGGRASSTISSGVVSAIGSSVSTFRSSASLERAVLNKVKRLARLSFLESFSDHTMLSVTIKRVSAATQSSITQNSSGMNDTISRKEKAKKALELGSYLKAATVMTKNLEKEFSNLKTELKASVSEKEWALYVEGFGTLKCKAMDRKDYSAVPAQFVSVKKTQYVTASLEDDFEKKGVIEFRKACGIEFGKGDLIDNSKVGKKRQRQ